MTPTNSMTTPSPGSAPEPFHASLADAVDRVAPSVLCIGTRRRGAASAVAWKPGVVVTTASAVGHAGRVHLVRPDGETVVGDVKGIDPSTDLAVLSAPSDALPVVERRLEPAVRVGDTVFAVGRDASGMVHASFGRVGAVGEAWRTWRGGQVDRLIRLDGGLYPGLVGSAVADAQGQVIGIASPALSRHHGIVLPVATVDRVSAALLAHGRIVRGFLGIATQPVALSAAMQAAAGTAARTGLLVAGLGDDGPAAQAGLIVGDIVVAVGGRDVPDIDALRAVLGAEQVGTRLRVQVLRGGQPIELAVEVAEHRPASRC